MAGRTGFNFEFHTARGGQPLPRDEETPFRILVIGDFSGRGSRGAGAVPPTLGRKPPRIDIDNFDKVFSGVSPRVHACADAAGAGGIDIAFRDIDDFHPDALLRKVEIFRASLAERAALQDPATFAAAAARLQRVLPGGPGAAAAQPVRSPEDDASTIGRLLGGDAPAGAPEPARPVAPASALQAFIAGIVAPHVVAAAPAHQAQYVAALDSALSEQLRQVLHDPGFQSVESTWLSLRRLLTEAGAGESIQVHLLDATVDDLRADMAASSGQIESAALARSLAVEAGDDESVPRWAVIAGAFALGLNDDDLELLAFLGAAAARAGAPILVDADSGFVGAARLDATPDPDQWVAPQGEVHAKWQHLRGSAVAPWIGLALPRVLARLPYGAKTDPLSTLAFEEVGAVLRHEDLLWGSAAVACALMCALGFDARGWSAEPGDVRDLGDLPALVRDVDGERRLHPVAGAWLSERACERILDAGLIPIASMRNANAARVPRFQSIASPARPLAGPWA